MSSLRWGGVGGKQLWFKPTRVSDGTVPAGSTWTMNPLPRVDSTAYPKARDGFPAPCFDPHGKSKRAEGEGAHPRPLMYAPAVVVSTHACSLLTLLLTPLQLPQRTGSAACARAGMVLTIWKSSTKCACRQRSRRARMSCSGAGSDLAKGLEPFACAVFCSTLHSVPSQRCSHSVYSEGLGCRGQGTGTGTAHVLRALSLPHAPYPLCLLLSLRGALSLVLFTFCPHFLSTLSLHTFPHHSCLAKWPCARVFARKL